MKATIKTQQKVELEHIIINGESLYSILSTIHKENLKCIQDISRLRNEGMLGFSDVDAPLYRVIDLIDKLKR